MSVSVPLGNRRRSAFSVAESQSEIQAIDARTDAQRNERYQLLFGRYQELLHARHEVQRLRDTMIPKAEQALAITRRGFEEGRFAFLLLDQSQQKLFELRLRAVEATARFHMLSAEVEGLTATAQDALP